MPRNAKRSDNIFEGLLGYNVCALRIEAAWPEFVAGRTKRLKSHPASAPLAKVTELILEDLLTNVLDWPLGSLTPQVSGNGFALSDRGTTSLIVAVEHAGALVWNRQAVAAALNQAAAYARKHGVGCVAVTDGVMLYAADLVGSRLRDRLFVSLSSSEAPYELWWLSVHGIWRSRQAYGVRNLSMLPDTKREQGMSSCASA